LCNIPVGSLKPSQQLSDDDDDGDVQIKLQRRVPFAATTASQDDSDLVVKGC